MKTSRIKEAGQESFKDKLSMTMKEEALSGKKEKEQQDENMQPSAGLPFFTPSFHFSRSPS
jgi:hypothetical protein